MRIDWLWLQDFKNLRNLEVDFDEDSLYTVLLGQNGTGKSNLIESLVMIFRDLDLGERPSLAYRIRYACRGRRIEVDADPKREKDAVNITVDGENIPFSRFHSNPDRIYLPKYLFGYYSGPSNRLERHFEKHQNRFYQALLKNRDRDGPLPLRPLFYARLIHSQFVLLSYFLDISSEQTGAFLREFLGIVGFDSVLFVMKRPNWSKNRSDLFWGARGEVRNFLERLHKIALAPMKIPRRGSDERFYLYVKDLRALLDLYRDYSGHGDFFKSLESTYISDIIEEVRIRVIVEGVDGNLTFVELSEGEQQLLTVLGLLRFTRDEESLFLLDEPDTHLNPAWGIRYFDLIMGIMNTSATSNIIVSTHDPLMVGSLTRDQVMLLFKTADGSIQAVRPDRDPRGLGVDGLLTSELFGLQSTLDTVTLRKLERKRELIASTELTDDDRKELHDLNIELSQLGFSRSFRDPLYQSFVDAIASSPDFPKLTQVVLTPEEKEAQHRAAIEVIQSIRRRQAHGSNR